MKPCTPKGRWIKHGADDETRPILSRPVRQHIGKINHQLVSGQVDFCVWDRNDFLPAENESRSDTLHRGQGTLDIEIIATCAIYVRFLQTFPDADPEHLGKRPKTAMALPELNKPIEVERTTRELPKIGILDLCEKVIDIAKLLPGGKGAHPRFIEPGHHDDQNVFLGGRLFRLLAVDRADDQLVGCGIAFRTIHAQRRYPTTPHHIILSWRH